MKLIKLFDEFLKDTVNLNATRISDLETSVSAIKKAIEGSSWEPVIREWAEQGSWAHKTIIKPVDQGEFDADLLVFVDPVSHWSAKEYIDSLYSALKGNGTYADKVRRYSHCVTIEYANDKKVDVAPCIYNRDGRYLNEVCNRTRNQFERTEPILYTEWLIEKNASTGTNSFRKVTRLIKYLRDIKERFTCTSVLLTTMLGYRVYAGDNQGDGFADTPTALKTLFGRLDDWLQLNPSKPSIANPFLASEDFAANWTEIQYANFCKNIEKYREWVDDAYDEKDRTESIIKWRRLFGDEFAKDAVLSEARSVGREVIEKLNAGIGSVSFKGDVVDAIKKWGAWILPSTFNRQPHMEAPRWRRASGIPVSVTVKAELARSRGGRRSARSINLNL